MRLARAVVFAAVCVVTTALGHALMSGDVLPWWAVGVAFAGTVSGAWWLTGRERGATAVVGATVVAQGLLHLLFSLAPATAASAGVPGSAGAHGMGHQAAISHSGMLMHHSGAPAGATGMPLDVHALSAVTHGGSVGMLLAHLVAAVTCGLWLWRGEAAVHRIGRALAAALLAPLRRVCRVIFRAAAGHEAPSHRAAVGGAEHRQTPAALEHAVVRRGPPRGRSAVSRLSPDPLLAMRP
ncbi:hypothetical protein AQJ91_37035 [Streptomyces dysideae]|uniref:Integral membrane protein n=1 Tax=Streptomyces dysideae TaxID=909626 RepID=A0A124IDU9_9ACTN|nr:hypothetical protein AQJ91_37035 [Streptomyces dysideae]